MKLTVFANQLSIVHKNSGTYNLVSADVCLTPIGKSVVPIPYTNLGHSRDTSGGPTTVLISGAMPMVKRAKYVKTSGDEPGTEGGVLSKTTRDEAEFISYSFDVKFEGRNVCRRNDTLFHNRRNVFG